jgi:competence protein ComGC
MPIPKFASRHSTAGLSRLEMLIALMVIAVLSTLLLKRLSELNGMARPARLQAAVSAVQAAATVFHARCLALQAAAGSVNCAELPIDGVPVAGALQWPAASADGIARAAQLPASGPAALRLRRTQRHGRPALAMALAERGCEFVYVQAESPDRSPEVEILDASCH